MTDCHVPEPQLVSTLVSSTATLKEGLTVELGALLALAIWRVADGHRDNQTQLYVSLRLKPSALERTEALSTRG